MKPFCWSEKVALLVVGTDAAMPVMSPAGQGSYRRDALTGAITASGLSHEYLKIMHPDFGGPGKGDTGLHNLRVLQQLSGCRAQSADGAKSRPLWTCSIRQYAGVSRRSSTSV